MEKMIEAGKSFVVFHVGQSEYIAAKEDFQFEIESLSQEDRFAKLIGRRHMVFIKAPNGLSAGMPQHDLYINLNGVAKIEVVSSETDRYKEIKSLWKAYQNPEMSPSGIVTPPKNLIVP
jgi:hypothetical protein